MKYLVANSWGARMLLWKWDLLEAGGHAAGKYFGIRSLRDLLCHVFPTFSFVLLHSWSPPDLWRFYLVLPLCWGCGCSLALALFSLYNSRYALHLHVCVHGLLLTLWEIRTGLSEEPFCCCSEARPLFPLHTQVKLSLWEFWGRCLNSWGESLNCLERINAFIPVLNSLPLQELIMALLTLQLSAEMLLNTGWFGWRVSS